MSVAPETTGSAPLLARDPSSAARRRSVQRFLDALAFADPEHGISFAYVMNQMEQSVLPNAKSLRLVEGIYSLL